MGSRTDEVIAMIGVGRYAEAERAARALAAQRPDSGMPWKLLGVSLRMQGKEALQVLRRAVQLLPDDAEVHYNLAAGLRAAHRLDEALAHYQRTIEIRPDMQVAHTGLGHVLLELGRCDEAVCTYQRALALQPAAAESHNNLGNALRALGKFEDAVGSCRRALELKPAFAEASNNLGAALQELGQLEEAVIHYRRALELAPGSAEAHSNLGMAQRLLGRHGDAQASCRGALALNPELPAAIALQAELYADQGRFAEAEQEFLRVIARLPNSAEAWAAIPRLRRMSREDTRWLAAAQRLVGQALPPRQEVFLRYALGKYFDDVKDYEQAFPNFERANALVRQYKPRYDRQRTTREVDRITRIHDREWLRRMRGHGNSSHRPVLIVGMPRSGTTLAEQILASHPSVFAAGELDFWKAASGDDGSSTIAALAEQYLRVLQGGSAEALRVLDKMPTNFLHLGLVHAAFPNARILHMRRNPVDTCLSIYCQHFRAVDAHANDLEDLAHYYREYRRLMQHWHATLPEESILDVPYEGVIEEQEGWSRRMLDFIGLPWDARCMEFHRTAGTVITASNWQVRQPLNRSSVERWRHYEPFIGALLQLLEA